jgi:hypothetical protein
LFKLSLSSPICISRSFFQTQDLFQASYFKPKTYLKIVLSSPKPVSSFLFQSTIFQVLWCSSFAFTSSFTHAQKIRGANSKLTSKLVHF